MSSNANRKNVIGRVSLALVTAAVAATVLGACSSSAGHSASSTIAPGSSAVHNVADSGSHAQAPGAAVFGSSAGGSSSGAASGAGNGGGAPSGGTVVAPPSTSPGGISLPEGKPTRGFIPVSGQTAPGGNPAPVEPPKRQLLPVRTAPLTAPVSPALPDSGADTTTKTPYRVGAWAPGGKGSPSKKLCAAYDRDLKQELAQANKAVGYAKDQAVLQLASDLDTASDAGCVVQDA